MDAFRLCGEFETPDRHALGWFLEAGLLHRRLEEAGELGEAVYRAGAAIAEASKASEQSHLEMLDALFIAIFGRCGRVVTSDELRESGFDDSREPDVTDYWEYF